MIPATTEQTTRNRGGIAPGAVLMLTAGWTSIDVPDGTTAQVLDKDMVYVVTKTAGEWRCDCPAFGGPIPRAHASAVGNVTSPL